MRWEYDPKQKLYVSETGRVVDQRTLHSLRDDYVAQVEPMVNDYAENVASGDWSSMRYEREMRTAIRTTHVAEYVLGRGGAGQMTAADWGRIGHMVKRQYGYLRALIGDMEAGSLTAGQIRARSAMYLGSARFAFNRGVSRSYGIDLPTYPANGEQQCLGQCKCRWSITETGNEFRAYWQLNAGAEHCETCVANASQYSPYVVEKEDAGVPV